MDTARAERTAPRYGFAGKGLELLGVRLVASLITTATCGIAWMLGVPRAMERRWLSEHVTRDGARFTYQSVFWENVKHGVVTWLLLAVTFGLASPWVIAMRCAHERSKMRTAEGHAVRFDGEGVEVIGLAALTFFGTLFSFGLAAPWLTVAWYRWATHHTLVEDPSAPGGAYRLRLDASGLDYLVVAAVNAILLVLTFGFASSWTAVRRERWRWSSTSDETVAPASAAAGARRGPTAAQWALVAGAAVAVLAALTVAGVGAAVLASRYLGGTDRELASPDDEHQVDVGAEVDPLDLDGLSGGEMLPEDYDHGDDEAPAVPAASPIRRPIAPLAPSTVAASSELTAGRVTYAARMAFDGSRDTAWAEGVEGPGRGEWIEARFSPPRVVRRIRMTTGYDKIHRRSGDLFPLNAHLRRVRVVFSDGTELARDVGPDEREITFDDLSVRAASVRFVADDVWEGTRWQDLSLSEIWIEGE
ncbi:MAG: hypothetical protein KF729_19000 [Sandaracinaceae bacterium]|nr:hypothetical protein [Sandaracinaceae bacterium]